MVVHSRNNEAHLRSCLDSLLAQTHRNLEIIVYDFASEDGSWDIISEFQRRHPGLLTSLRLRKDYYPDALVELVPAYLDHEPVDFADRKPLRYRRKGGDYVLYSIGADGKDDGGKTMMSNWMYSSRYDFPEGDHKYVYHGSSGMDWLSLTNLPNIDYGTIHV